MNIWLVTTGSSDVQLTSDKDWNDWYQAIKRSVQKLPFKPVRAIDDEGEPYRLPARVLGIAYDRLADAIQPKLTFPLLDGFTLELKAQKVAIDQIIVLMSDQEDVFPEAERGTNRSPYWQDTCRLYPILESYFHEHFPDALLTPLVLKPESVDRGLDNWDAVLGLVQRKIGSLDIEPETVYVSHQAGTPATSSAVQFASLAKFGDRVQFLVSNEYDSGRTRTIASSKYLGAIRLQEAKALLDRYDYSGVQSLLKSYLKEGDTQTLLNAAIQWNVAQFSEFTDTLTALSDPCLVQAVQKRLQHWWWVAYEEVYLAVIRSNQDNIVEAFFHSFRAFEGIFALWGSHRLRHQFEEYFEINDGVSYLNLSVLDTEEEYFSGKEPKSLKKKLEKIRKELREKSKPERIMLDMAMLCKFFRAYRYQDYENSCEELKIFWDDSEGNNVSKKRNFIVHQIQGMSKMDLMNFWGVSSSKEWESRLLKFLNFIAKDDLHKEFESLEEASLMAQVHRKLIDAIDKL